MSMQVPHVFGPNDLRLCEVETPRPGPRDVVLRVGAVGICGSDLGFIALGGLAGPTDRPFPLGHELSGVVAEVGAEVSSVAVGDRVIVNPLVNLIGNGAPEGGFAPYLLVRDVVARPGSLVPLPDEISLETGALIEPLAVSLHAANRLGAKPGDRVAIMGGGPIGLSAVVGLRHRGVDDIVLFDFSAFRRERALQLGARLALDPGEAPLAEALLKVHGETSFFGHTVPATTHFLEASGAPIIPQIAACAAPGVTICVASYQKKPVELNFQLMLGKELTITMALGYPSELTDVVGMLQAGGVDPNSMISHRFPGDRVMEAFEMAPQIDKASKVIVQYDV